MTDEQPENRAEHLRPHQWQPGQSGNRKGRPKGRGVVDFLHKYGRMKADKVPSVRDKAISLGLDPKRVTVAEVTALKLWADAATSAGASAMRTLLDRLHGAVVPSDLIGLVGEIEDTIARAERGNADS